MELRRGNIDEVEAFNFKIRKRKSNPKKDVIDKEKGRLFIIGLLAYMASPISRKTGETLNMVLFPWTSYPIVPHKMSKNLLVSV